MPNKYGSAIRTYVARNVGEVQIHPPAACGLASAGFRPQFFRLTEDYLSGDLPMSSESNIHIHRAGLFSNFADGLVPRDATSRLNLSIFTGSVTRNGTPLTGLVSYSPASLTLTGDVNTLFLTELSVGTLLMLDNFPYYVDTVTANDSCTVTDYPRMTRVNWAIAKYVTWGTGSYELQLLDIMNLNHMYQVDWFWPLATIGALASNQLPLFQARVTVDAYANIMYWLTNSISTSYDDEYAFFDVLMELEFTYRIMNP